MLKMELHCSSGRSLKPNIPREPVRFMLQRLKNTPGNAVGRKGLNFTNSMSTGWELSVNEAGQTHCHVTLIHIYIYAFP